MKKLHEFLVFREFAFAPGVLTVCAKSREALARALGSDNHPFIQSKVASHPVATYLSEQSLKNFKAEYWMDASVSLMPISKVSPEKWIVSLTDGVKMYGLSVMSADDVPDLVEKIEAHGQKIAAMPLPRGLLN